MKFRCGLTEETKAEREFNQLKADADYYRNWHSVFAWTPIKVGDNDCRWLEYVERRCPTAIADWHTWLVYGREIMKRGWLEDPEYRAIDPKKTRPE